MGRDDWPNPEALDQAAIDKVWQTMARILVSAHALFVATVAYGLIWTLARAQWQFAAETPPLRDDEVHPRDLDDYFEARCQWEADWVDDRRSRLGRSYQPQDITWSPPPCPIPPPKTWGERKKEIVPHVSRADRPKSRLPQLRDPDVR